MRKAQLKVGNHTGLELCVPHPEVAEHAITIDNRGATPLIVNKNPYAIYVGVDRLEPNACVPWAESIVVQLTKNVTLELSHTANNELQSASTREIAKSEAKSPKDSSQLLQIGVVVLCCVIGGLTLMRDNSPQSSSSNYSFNELRQQAKSLSKINQGPTESFDALLAAMNNIPRTDRPGQENNVNDIIAAYRKLAKTEAVRHPTELQKELADKIEKFCSGQIQRIKAEMDYR